MRKPNFPAAIVLALTIVGLPGCKKGSGVHVIAAPAAQLEGGWTLATSIDKTVTIGVPPSWRAGVDAKMPSLPNMAGMGGSGNDSQPPSDQGFGQQLQQMEQQMDAENKQHEEEALAALDKKGIIIHVVNSSKPIPGEQRTRFYIKRVHDSGVSSLQDAAEAERQHYDAKHKPVAVTLPIGPAFKITEDDSLRDGMTMHQISFVILDDADTYLLRFETEEDGAVINQIADAVANSLRITPAKRT